jgi:hypothetical protein
MTFYKSIPVVVEALRFDGSGTSATRILDWLTSYDINDAVFHEQKKPYTLPGNTFQSPGWHAQLDLGIPHVKIAESSDYVVRLDRSSRGLSSKFKVMTEEDFRSTYVVSCPTCSGRIRETVGMVCMTCGHDYSKGI